MLKAEVSDRSTISPAQTVLLFACFVVLVILIIVAKKIYYRIRYKKRYYIFPRIRVKGIANIAMVISIAVVILLLLTVLTAGLLGVLFRAYPGWRVTIESILIKIGGLLFGPIIGMFVGAATDILSITLTAGMFHYGFFIVAIAYGLIAGIIREILNWNHNRQVWFAVCSTILIVLCLVASAIFLSVSSPPNGYTVTVFNKDIIFQWWTLALMITSVCLICLVVLWVCMFIFYRPQLSYAWTHLVYWILAKRKMNQYRWSLIHLNNKQKVADKQLAWHAKNHDKIARLKFHDDQKYVIVKRQKDSWIAYFCPVMIMVMASELILNVFVIPIFDPSLSGVPYETWLAGRVFLTVFTIPVNILIIYPVYRIVAPSMHYNYQNDVTEGLSVPLMMD